MAKICRHIARHRITTTCNYVPWFPMYKACHGVKRSHIRYLSMYRRDIVILAYSSLKDMMLTLASVTTRITKSWSILLQLSKRKESIIFALISLEMGKVKVHFSLFTALVRLRT